MALREFINNVRGDFDDANVREKICLFAWFLHTQAKKDAFRNADIRSCFTEIHLADPNVAKYLPRMVHYGDLIKANGSFKLARHVRTELDSKYAGEPNAIFVAGLLAELPGKIPDVAEHNFLTEALNCYRSEAFRACIVMTWNLAYSHLLHWILADSARLAAFNSAVTRRMLKKQISPITKYDEFLDHLKEAEVIDLCGAAALVNNNSIRVLREK